MKLTKEDIKLAQEKARGSKLELINQVTKAYYQALLAKDSYQVMKQSYETSKLNYEIISERERVGKVSEYDKLSAEVQMRSMNSSWRGTSVTPLAAHGSDCQYTACHRRPSREL